MHGWTPTELREYLHYHEESEKLLNELIGIGFKHKTVDHIRFICYTGTAAWKGMTDSAGYIAIYEQCEPGAVAHELGHGFHECLRKDYNQPKKFGEAYAEAIRWFVEERLGNITWCNKFKLNRRDDEILQLCFYNWNQFKDNLANKKFSPS